MFFLALPMVEVMCSTFFLFKFLGTFVFKVIPKVTYLHIFTCISLFWAAVSWDSLDGKKGTDDLVVMDGEAHL